VTRPEVRRLALRIAGELRERTTEAPRTYAFALRDDKHLRVIDQVVSTGRRVLTLEAYRGSVGVYGQYPTVRFDGPVDAPWFADGMSARDEGNALTVLENALTTQLDGGDFERRDADVRVDVRKGTVGAEPYTAHFGPVDYARVLARGSLLAAFWSFVAAWVVFILGGLLAASVGSMISALTIVGLVLTTLFAVIAVMVAGHAGRGGNATRATVLAGLAFIWVPLAPAMPVGPFLAVVGGSLLVAAAASAAAVRVWASVGGFAAVGLVASIAGSALWSASPTVSLIVIGAGMIVATVAAALLIRRASRAGAASRQSPQ
jgi:hypothetical protein